MNKNYTMAIYWFLREMYFKPGKENYDKLIKTNLNNYRSRIFKSTFDWLKATSKIENLENYKTYIKLVMWDIKREYEIIKGLN